MKTDKELLELAAKSAGLNYRDGRVTYARGYMFGNEPLVVDWNPLTDDGDAFRLAVKLNFLTGVYVGSSTVWSHDDYITEHNDDKGVATRRAIVRAAAAIGEVK